MTKFLPLCFTLIIGGQASAAEWIFDAEADPTLKYDDNELLRENERGDFSLNIDPTLIISRSLENARSELRLGYRINRYDRLRELDREDPFAHFSTNYNTERSEYGLDLEYSEREARSIAEEDTGDFSNTSTVTTKSIRPNFSYNLTELDRLITGFGYTDRKFDNSNALSTNELSDNEIIDASVAWEHSFSERLIGGLSALFVNYEAETDTFTNEYDSYALSVTSSYALSELWQLSGQLGMWYLDSEISPNIGPSISDTNTGETYAFSANRKDEVSDLSLSASRALLPSSRGEVNEQDIYEVSYTRNLTERLAASIHASYRKFEDVSGTFATDTKYTELSPNLRWSLAENLALVFAYKYRSVKRSSNFGDADSNAVLVTLDYNWDGIRFSR